MPEEKLIELIEWVGQEYIATNLKLHCGDKTILTNLEHAKLTARANAFKEIWDKFLKVANNHEQGLTSTVINYPDESKIIGQS
jgi:hypothetical protein